MCVCASEDPITGVCPRGPRGAKGLQCPDIIYVSFIFPLSTNTCAHTHSKNTHFFSKGFQVPPRSLWLPSPLLAVKTKVCCGDLQPRHHTVFFTYTVCARLDQWRDLCVFIYVHLHTCTTARPFFLSRSECVSGVPRVREHVLCLCGYVLCVCSLWFLFVFLATRGPS